MKTENDIIDFVINWCESNKLSTEESLKKEHISSFIGELQEQIALMDFTLPEGSAIIGYTGDSNGIGAWQIVKNISDAMKDKAGYISDLPAGKLLNKEEFLEEINNLIGNENIIDKITSGYDNDIRLEGGSCGYGDYLSLDDFVFKIHGRE